MADSNFKAHRLEKKTLRDAVLDQIIEVFKRPGQPDASLAEFYDALHELCAVCSAQELRKIAIEISISMAEATGLKKIRSRTH
jgi:hypothetical protein